MAKAEYESQKALAAVIPNNVVIPTAWGMFERDKSRSFFMTRFRNLREYFSRQFRSDISYLEGVYGPDSELASLTEAFIKKVVARLLRPLQTGGRSIKPTLCHGDLWDGNVQIDVDTKQPVMFDSCTFYGHNES